MAKLGTNTSNQDTDYSKLSLDDLHALQQRMAQEIETRRTADRDNVIQQIKALAAEHGLDVTINGTGRRGKGKKTKEGGIRATVPVKYQHPQNKDLKWTGRGRKPAWVNEWEGTKGSLDALKVG